MRTSSRASPGGSSALRTSCTRRSELVTVPLLSHHDAEPGSTTSASCAVLVRKMSCTTRWSRPSSSSTAWALVGLRLGGVLADHVQRPQLAAAHRGEHVGEVPAVARRHGDVPRGVELRPRDVVLDVLEAGQLVRQGAHVAAALDVVLAAQRVEPGAPATDVTAQQGEVDEGEHVVDGVVVLGDAERPAQLGAVGAGVGVGQLADGLGRDAGDRRATLERPLLAPRRRTRRTRSCRARRRSALTSPAAMISRAIVLDRAMSVPTCRPSQRSANCAVDVRRGSTT